MRLFVRQEDVSIRVSQIVLLSSAFCALCAAPVMTSPGWGCGAQPGDFWFCDSGTSAAAALSPDLAAMRAASAGAAERASTARLAALNSELETRRGAVVAEEARAAVVVERLLSLQLEAVEMRVANAVARRRTAAAETAQMVRVRTKMAFPSERLPVLRGNVETAERHLDALHSDTDMVLRPLAKR